MRPRISDFREGDPAIEKGINNSTVFLSLVSLIALIIGALGVGMAMYSHIQQRMDTIAVMKAVGAQSSQIITVYLLQTLWLGFAGGVLGVALWGDYSLKVHSPSSSSAASSICCRTSPGIGLSDCKV